MEFLEFRKRWSEVCQWLKGSILEYGKTLQEYLELCDPHLHFDFGVTSIQ
jgi:hypothetical protein